MNIYANTSVYTYTYTSVYTYTHIIRVEKLNREIYMEGYQCIPVR